MKFTAQQIAAFIGGEVVGDPDVAVSDFTKIEEGRPGALSFLANPKYEEYIYSTESSIVLVNSSFIPSKEIKATLIKVENAYASLAKLLQLSESVKPRKSGVHNTAIISESARIGSGAYIGPYVVIGDNSVVGANAYIDAHCFIGDFVSIGDNLKLHSGVKIMDATVIGNNFSAQAGAVVGSDGFGFAPTTDGVYDKIPQVGNVKIEDDVEIGANSTIDRATMGSTIIGRGTKLDNHVQIAHNVEVGKNCVIAALVGIAGSVKVGDGCMFGGQAGIAGHLKIGDNVKLGAQTGVMNNIPNGETWIGFPAVRSTTFMRSHALSIRLPEINRTVTKLQKEIEILKQQ
ncbi:MAG: UDP-3-O-(3-hydroxymyristoyl)glucosamine N-acyltransferase [Bacteroidales bacterium]